MKKHILLILIFSVVFGGCKSHINSTTINQNNPPQQNNSSQDLTARLQGFSGVQIQGTGSNATISIRGINSFELNNEPLFIIDGTQFSGSYSALYNSISVNDIKKIEVLKDGGSLGMYGVNGANGVIKIATIH